MTRGLIAHQAWIAVLVITICPALGWTADAKPRGTMRCAHEVNCVALSPDGKTLAAGDGDGNIKLFDVGSTKQTGSFRAHANSIAALAFSPDGKLLISGAREGAIKLWAMPGAKQTGTLEYAEYDAVTSMALSPDGKTLAAGGTDWDRAIKRWDLASGKALGTFKLHGTGQWIYSLAFNPAGDVLASGGGEDNKIRLWDLAGGKELAALSGHSSQVKSIAFSPDGQILASGSNDDKVKLWDVRTRKQSANLVGHKDEVYAVAFSPDGKMLASGDMSGRIKLWGLAAGEEVASIKGHEISVNSLAFSPDGKMLISGGSDKAVKLWDIKELMVKNPALGLRNPDYLGWVGFKPGSMIRTSNSVTTVMRMRMQIGKIVTYNDLNDTKQEKHHETTKTLLDINDKRAVIEVKTWQIVGDKKVEMPAEKKELPAKLAEPADEYARQADELVTIGNRKIKCQVFSSAGGCFKDIRSGGYFGGTGIVKVCSDIVPGGQVIFAGILEGSIMKSTVTETVVEFVVK